MRLVLLTVAVALLGCAPRAARTAGQPEIPPPPELPASPEDPQTASLADPAPDFIDLQPGSIVRVVTPLLKSGGYLPRTDPGQASGNTVTLVADKDLIGYETTFYSVRPRHGGGVSVDFLRAEVTRKGHTHPQASSRGWPLTLPSEARFVRLIYLTRLSATDYDMALVATAEAAALDDLTREVKSARCESGSRGFCAWVPAGVAVTPESGPAP